MAAPVKIVDRDHGYKRTLNALGPLGRVTLGVMGEKGDAQHKGSEITVAEVGLIHELGLGVPERSWLRAWIDENRQVILADSRDAIQQVIFGKLTKEKALDVLGVKWSASIKARITAGQIEPPLADSTKERKGSSVPLIDTAQFLSAITYAASTDPASLAELILSK